MRGGAVLYFMQGIQEVLRAVLLLSRLHLPLEYIQDEQHARGLLSGVPLLGDNLHLQGLNLGCCR